MKPSFRPCREICGVEFSDLVAACKMPSGVPRPRYSDHIRELIEDCVVSGISTGKIAASIGVSPSIVSRLRSVYNVFATVSPLYPGVQGRPRKIYKEVEEGIIDFIEEYPTARQDEVYDFLLDKYDININ